MFLATTALEEFWDTSKEILFLGEWCKLYSRKPVWEKINHHVLSYHWDDRKKLFADYQYLDNVYERYLDQMVEALNRLHKTNHSERYWRIIIGPWLFYFVEILFDRYESIRKAINEACVTETWIPKNVGDLNPPYDFNHFFSLAVDDPYNQMLYSLIILKLGALPYEIKHIHCPLPLSSSLRKKHAKIKKGLLALLSLYHHLIPTRLIKYAFVNSYLRWKDVFLLQMRLSQPPYPLTDALVRYPALTPDAGWRKNLASYQGKNEFEHLLDELIPAHIPLLYVEGYSKFKQEIYRHFPKKTRLIFTANASIGIEAFKFWAADQTEQGAKLLLTQHGGHHGMGKMSAELNHELSISDRYFTWGWKEEGNSKVQPMPSGQLAKYKKIEPKKDGDILWVMMGLPRYSYWLYSLPIGPQMLSYLDDQKKFYDSLREEAKELILIKPYMKDFGWNDRLRLKDAMPAARQYSGSESMYQLLKRSRLFIGTYNSTTYLETFITDFPTIMFWNPDHWEIRPHVQPFFDLLLEANILYYDPISAAQKVNEIFEDPISWWHTPKVQKAKEDFCREFAWTEGNWGKKWVSSIRLEGCR